MEDIPNATLIDYYAAHASEADIESTKVAFQSLIGRCRAKLAFGTAMVAEIRRGFGRIPARDLPARDLEETLALPVEVLELACRASNSVRNLGCKTLNDLVKITPRQIIDQRNIGVRALKEVEIALNRYGLKLKRYGK